VGWRNFFFQLCCFVSFWFWREIDFSFTYLRTFPVRGSQAFGIVYIHTQNNTMFYVGIIPKTYKKTTNLKLATLWLLAPTRQRQQPNNTPTITNIDHRHRPPPHLTSQDWIFTHQCCCIGSLPHHPPSYPSRHRLLSNHHQFKPGRGIDQNKHIIKI
jgi:hypothetical protein